MGKATETEEPQLIRVRAYTKEQRAVAEAPEAKLEREEKLARREAERREWSLEIFNEERWSRETTLLWIARRDPHDMSGSIVGAVFHDRNLPGREPSALLTEAIADKKIKEYSDGRRTWYRSEQVKAAFPQVDPSGEKAAAVQVVAAEAPPLPTSLLLPAKPRLVDRLADELSKKYPDGRPAMTNPQILKDLGRNCSKRTLNRAIKKAGWSPPVKPSAK